jgi:hypothetical protein
VKRLLTGALAAAAALGVTLALIPGAASAAPVTNPQACERMSGTTLVIGLATPVCSLVWVQKGAPNVRLPEDKPQMVYGVLYRTSYGSAPSALILRDGTRLPLKASEAAKWTRESSVKVAQTIVRAEVLKPNLPSREAVRTTPYVFIADDALVDHSAGSSFSGRFANANNSKKVWARINWSPKGKVGADVTGAIANWDIAVQDGAICHASVQSQYAKDMARTVGGKKVRLAWVPNTYAGGQAYFVITTDTGVKFFRNAPSLSKLVNSTWDPLVKGKLNFKSTDSPTKFNRLNIAAITPRVDTVKCKPE